MQDVLTLILGGGRGARLYPLTKTRSEPAVPVAGKYRLIDIPISNCLNSGLNRIYVLTQFLSVSLHRHIAQTYEFDAFNKGFVEVLAAQQTNEAAAWYQGTADALRQNLRYIQEDGAREVLVLSGDQLYRMDFQALVQAHRAAQADISMALVPVTRSQAGNLGVVRLDDGGRVVRLVEKPQTEEHLVHLRTPAAWFEKRRAVSPDRDYLANMGIYVFNRKVLFDLLSRHSSETDLVTQIFPRCLHDYRMQGYLHSGYWEDLGTVRTYYEANLALAGEDPPFDFHSPEGIIYTRMRFLPASRVSAASVQHSLISDGCVVSPGTQLERCLLGVRSRIGQNVVLRNTVILGANSYETEADRAVNRRQNIPDMGVGDDSVLEGVIVDKNCRIGRNVRISNRGQPEDSEGGNYVVREGIVVIPNGAIVPDGTVI